MKVIHLFVYRESAQSIYSQEYAKIQNADGRDVRSSSKIQLGRPLKRQLHGETGSTLMCPFFRRTISEKEKSKEYRCRAVNVKPAMTHR